MGKRKSRSADAVSRNQKRLLAPTSASAFKETPLNNSLVVEGANRDSFLKESVSKLLSTDRNCVSLKWQKAREHKTQDNKKRRTVAPKAQLPTRNGLHRWTAAESIFQTQNPTSFTALDLNAQLSEVLEQEMEFRRPTAVQSLLIPSILEGSDVDCGAGTESGKTVGYLLPIVHSLMTQQPRISREAGTRIIILCPDVTRCEALAEVLTRLTQKLCWWITCSVFAGGENRKHEKSRLRKGVTVMITTETRLMDHLENTSAFRADGVQTFVVDGAAELLSSKRGGKLRRANQILQEACRSAGSGRMQNVICTDACHPELAFLCVCMLRDPIAIGFEFSKKADGHWIAAAVEGWGLQEHEEEAMLE